MSRPRILLLISGGWAVRNYIRSGLLDFLIEQAEVIVMMPSGDPNFETELRSQGVRVEFFSSYSIPRGLSILNHLLVNAHNRRLGLWHPVFWRRVSSLEPFWKRPYLELFRAASVLVQNENIFQVGRRLHDKWLHTLSVLRSYQLLFDDLRPDIVVSTNPFNWSELPVVLLAQQSGVPTVTAILSWDNLSYKGFPLARFSRYAVWSKLMKQELLRAEPELDPDQIVVTGTPQFDFHLAEDLVWGRGKLFERIGADPSRPLITYSACTDLTFPEEPEVVEVLWGAIERRKVLDRPQLLLRLHPHDLTDRFEHLRTRCPGLLFSRPCEHTDRRFWWFNPRREDLALFSNTLRYSDVNVNVFSTVALDSATLDRPIVCIAFSNKPKGLATEYFRVAPFFGHCKYMSESGAVKIAFNLEELISHLNFYLKNTSADRDARRRMVEQICGPVDGQAVKRMMDCILGVLQAREACAVSE